MAVKITHKEWEKDRCVRCFKEIKDPGHEERGNFTLDLAIGGYKVWINERLCLDCEAKMLPKFKDFLPI